MKRITAHAVGIQQGSRVLFSDFVNDGPMWAGEGDRECRVTINFTESFEEAPMMHVSIGMWDTSHSHNSRIEIFTENITPSQFDVVFRTWEDTKVARLRVDWLAIGSPISDDDW
jgi:hypothetical protein